MQDKSNEEGKLEINGVPLTYITYVISDIKKDENNWKMKSIISRAKKSFEASNILREKEDIASSIFHLQQSVELLTKLCYVGFGIDTPKSHNQAELIDNLIRGIRKQCGNCFSGYENQTRKEIQNLKVEIRDIKKRIALARSEEFIKKHLVNIEALESRLSMMENENKICEGVKEIVYNPDLINDPDFQELTKWCLDLMKNLKNLGVEEEKINYYKEKIIEESKKIVSNPESLQKITNSILAIFRFGIAVSEIIECGVILCPHETFTRYPDEGISPESYDKKEIPIAKDDYYYKLHDVIENAIKRIDEAMQILGVDY
jgi:HEPN domain-containing protein